MNRSRLRWLLAAILAALVLLPTLACTPKGEATESQKDGQADAKRDKKKNSKKNSEKNGDEESGEDEKERVPVEIAALGRGGIESVLRYSTNLEAESEVQVFSEASRQVTALLVEEGDPVRKGQVLLRLQDDEQRSALARAESQLKKAEREYERQQRLFERELISEQAFNDATYELDQNKIAFEDAKRELSYTEVRAPISGRVTARLVNLGDHITVNQHLFDIVDFDSIVARVFVPEREMSRIGVGQPARLFSSSAGGGARLGKVLRIAPVVDARSGTVKTTIAIPRNQGLLPGQYVEVELIADTHEDAILIPKRALVFDNEQTYVFRIVGPETPDGHPKAERVIFQPLLEDRSWVEPAGDLLQAGDRVVVAGQQGLKDGVEVRVLGDAPTAVSPVDGEAADQAADETAPDGEEASP